MANKYARILTIAIASCFFAAGLFGILHYFIVKALLILSILALVGILVYSLVKK